MTINTLFFFFCKIFKSYIGFLCVNNNIPLLLQDILSIKAKVNIPIPNNWPYFHILFFYASLKKKFKAHLNTNSLPLTLVAYDDNHPVGICSLREDDGLNNGFTPWLASLAVDSSYKRRGIGKKLIEGIINKAKELGFKKLYLFVIDHALIPYYSRIGFKKLNTDTYNGSTVTVMEFTTTNKV